MDTNCLCKHSSVRRSENTFVKQCLQGDLSCSHFRLAGFDVFFLNGTPKSSTDHFSTSSCHNNPSRALRVPSRGFIPASLITVQKLRRPAPLLPTCHPVRTAFSNSSLLPPSAPLLVIPCTPVQWLMSAMATPLFPAAHAPICVAAVGGTASGCPSSTVLCDGAVMKGEEALLAGLKRIPCSRTRRQTRAPSCSPCAFQSGAQVYQQESYGASSVEDSPLHGQEAAVSWCPEMCAVIR